MISEQHGKGGTAGLGLGWDTVAGQRDRQIYGRSSCSSTETRQNTSTGIPVTLYCILHHCKCSHLWGHTLCITSQRHGKLNSLVIQLHSVTCAKTVKRCHWACS